MARRVIEFDDENLAEFDPRVAEALTRLSWQQQNAHRAEPTRGGFQVVDRVTDKTRAARIKAQGGKNPRRIDHPGRGNPAFPDKEE